MATAWHHRRHMIPIVTPAEMARDRRRRARAGRGADRAGRSRARPRRGRHARRHVRPPGRRARRQGQQRQRRPGRGAPAAPARSASRRCSTPPTSPPTLPAADLVIDAAYGTGFRGIVARAARPTRRSRGRHPQWRRRAHRGGRERVLAAERTVTFAALKPGLLLGGGRELAGEVEVVDIGLDVSDGLGLVGHRRRRHRWLLPPRSSDAHKWKAAVWIAAGSPGMTGAAHLAARGAQRAGRGLRPARHPRCRS